MSSQSFHGKLTRPLTVRSYHKGNRRDRPSGKGHQLNQKQIDAWTKRAKDLTPEERALVVGCLNRYQAAHYKVITTASGETYGDLYLDITRGLHPMAAA